MLMMWAGRRRRMPPWQRRAIVLRTLQAPWHVKVAGSGAYRISSGAFSPHKDGTVSVDLGQLLRADLLPLVALHPHGKLKNVVGLSGLPVSKLEAEGLKLRHSPVWSNWYHASLSGADLKKPALRKRLAKACRMIVEIDSAAADRAHAIEQAATVTT